MPKTLFSAFCVGPCSGLRARDLVLYLDVHSMAHAHPVGHFSFPWSPPHEKKCTCPFIAG